MCNYTMRLRKSKTIGLVRITYYYNEWEHKRGARLRYKQFEN